MVTILKWGDYSKKNCLFLGELTIKRHSFLGRFVPSLIQNCKKRFWNTHVFCRESREVNLYFSCFVCREKALWFPIIHLNNPVMEKALFHGENRVSSFLLQRCCGEVLWLIPVMTRFPLIFKWWLAINSIPPQHERSGDSTSLWCRTRASSGSPTWKTDSYGLWYLERTKRYRLFKCYCRRIWSQNLYVRKNWSFVQVVNIFAITHVATSQKPDSSSERMNKGQIYRHTYIKAVNDEPQTLLHHQGSRNSGCWFYTYEHRR